LGDEAIGESEDSKLAVIAAHARRGATVMP